jgi:hypothetical protein
MSSLYSRYPDPLYLLALERESLAALLLPYFRSLPWQLRRPVLRCIHHHVSLYPLPERKRLSEAFVDAWDFAMKEGLIVQAEAQHRTVVQFTLSSVRDEKHVVEIHVNTGRAAQR